MKKYLYFSLYFIAIAFNVCGQNKTAEIKFVKDGKPIDISKDTYIYWFIVGDTTNAVLKQRVINNKITIPILYNEQTETVLVFRYKQEYYSFGYHTSYVSQNTRYTFIVDKKPYEPDYNSEGVSRGYYLPSDDSLFNSREYEGINILETDFLEGGGHVYRYANIKKYKEYKKNIKRFIKKTLLE